MWFNQTRRRRKCSTIASKFSLLSRAAACCIWNISFRAEILCTSTSFIVERPCFGLAFSPTLLDGKFDKSFLSVSVDSSRRATFARRALGKQGGRKIPLNEAAARGSYLFHPAAFIHMRELPPQWLWRAARRRSVFLSHQGAFFQSLPLFPKRYTYAAAAARDGSLNSQYITPFTCTHATSEFRFHLLVAPFIFPSRRPLHSYPPGRQLCRGKRYRETCYSLSLSLSLSFLSSLLPARTIYNLRDLIARSLCQYTFKIWRRRGTRTIFK